MKKLNLLAFFLFTTTAVAQTNVPVAVAWTPSIAGGAMTTKIYADTNQFNVTEAGLPAAVVKLSVPGIQTNAVLPMVNTSSATVRWYVVATAVTATGESGPSNLLVIDYPPPVVPPPTRPEPPTNLRSLP